MVMGIDADGLVPQLYSSQRAQLGSASQSVIQHHSQSTWSKSKTLVHLPYDLRAIGLFTCPFDSSVNGSVCVFIMLWCWVWIMFKRAIPTVVSLLIGSPMQNMTKERDQMKRGTNLLPCRQTRDGQRLGKTNPLTDLSILWLITFNVTKHYFGFAQGGQDRNDQLASWQWAQ